MQQPFSGSTMEKKVIRVLGNEFLDQDSLAIELSRQIRMPDVIFEMITQYDDLMKTHEIIMDVCKGIDKATLITDIDEFLVHRTSTVHDMDFGFFLKLNKSMGTVHNVNIIAVPQKAYKGIKEDIINIIRGL